MRRDIGDMEGYTSRQHTEKQWKTCFYPSCQAAGKERAAQVCAAPKEGVFTG